MCFPLYISGAPVDVAREIQKIVVALPSNSATGLRIVVFPQNKKRVAAKITELDVA